MNKSTAIVFSLVAAAVLSASSIGCSNKKAAADSCGGHGNETGHNHGAAQCAEHGMPEASCTVCNPALIASFKEKGDWCEKHGMPESLCTGCNPALAGKLALPPENTAAAGIETARLQTSTVAITLEAPGEVLLDEQKVRVISAPVAGRIDEVNALLLARVACGAPLITLFSPTFAAMQDELLQARKRIARLETAPGASGAGTERDIYESARSRLEALGCSASEIAELEQRGIASQRLVLRAPLGGTITEANARNGVYIDAGQALCTVADISSVWVVAAISEKDIGSVRKGMNILLRSNAYPDETFGGTVAAVGDILDAATRTFKVRVDCANPGGKLKPGMWVNVDLVTQNRKGLAVPEQSLLLDGSDRYIFVKGTDGAFYRRGARILGENDTAVQIATDLSEGEEVVVRGAYLLKSEMLRASMGDGCAD